MASHMIFVEVEHVGSGFDPRPQFWCNSNTITKNFSRLSTIGHIKKTKEAHSKEQSTDKMGAVHKGINTKSNAHTTNHHRHYGPSIQVIECVSFSSYNELQGVQLAHFDLDAEWTQIKTMSVNKREDTTESAISSPGLCGATMWQNKVDAIDVLACADTVEDILPNNKITKYLKSKYETDSLPSNVDENEDDDSTLFTLNTTGNTLNTLNTLNITAQTVERSVDHTLDRTRDSTLNQSLDNTLDQTMDCPYDEGIEVEMANVPLPPHLQTSSYTELLSDLVVTPPETEDETCTVRSSEGTNTTTLGSKSGLTFAPWIGDDTKEQTEPEPTPLPPPLSSISPNPSSDNDDATDDVASKTSGNSKEGGKSICSNGSNSTATNRSVEVIGTIIKKEKKKIVFRSLITSIKKGSEEDEDDEDEYERQAKEHRWEEMKAILKATAEIKPTEIEDSWKRKGTWKQTVKGAMESLRIGKKKMNAPANEEEEDGDEVKSC